MEIEELFKITLDKLEKTSTILYLYGETNTGKSYAGNFIAECFGRNATLDFNQLCGGDVLVFDTIMRTNAFSVYCDEIGPFLSIEEDLHFSRQLKRILCGIPTEPRTSKVRRPAIGEFMQVELLVITSNVPPSCIEGFNDPALKRRLLPVYITKRFAPFAYSTAASTLFTKYSKSLDGIHKHRKDKGDELNALRLLRDLEEVSR